MWRVDALPAMGLRQRVLAFAVCGLIVLGAFGCTSARGATSDVQHLPLPPGAQEIKVVGEVERSGARSATYAMDAQVTLRDVSAFYREVLPPGDDFGEWQWCESSADHGSSEYSWSRDGNVLALEYFRQDGSSLLEIPPDSVVLIVSEGPGECG